MFEMIIKFANGDIYWRSFFNSMEEANAWLAIEQTRPYWKQEFTVDFIDHSPSAEEVAAQIKAQKIVELEAAADNEIRILMSGMEFTTKLGEAMYLLDMALNVSGEYGEEQIAYAKANLASYRNLMRQVQAIRTQRDVKIAELG